VFAFRKVSLHLGPMVFSFAKFTDPFNHVESDAEFEALLMNEPVAQAAAVAPGVN
jgi:hypothetical protein